MILPHGRIPLGRQTCLGRAAFWSGCKARRP